MDGGNISIRICAMFADLISMFKLITNMKNYVTLNYLVIVKYSNSFMQSPIFLGRGQIVENSWETMEINNFVFVLYFLELFQAPSL